MKRCDLVQPVRSEEDADRVIAAAAELAAENGTDPDPPPPAKEAPDQGAWLHEYGDKKDGEFELAARRAVLGYTEGDIPSAQAMYAALSEGMEHPLSQDDYYVVKSALADPGAGA